MWRTFKVNEHPIWVEANTYANTQGMHTLQSCSSKWIIQICSTVKEGEKKKGECKSMGKKDCRQNEVREDEKRGVIQDGESEKTVKQEQREIKGDTGRNSSIESLKDFSKRTTAKTEGCMEEERNPMADHSSSHPLLASSCSLLHLNSWSAD